MHAVGGACQAVDEVMGVKRKAPTPSSPCARRPPRRNLDADGLLLLQQRRHRRASRASRTRRRAHRDHGFRRAPRQRDAGHILGRQIGDVRFHPPDAALPGTGGQSEEGEHGTIVKRRWRQATAGRSFARRWTAEFCRASTLSARSRHRLGRLRRAPARPAGADQPLRRRLRLGDSAADGGGGQERGGASSSPCSKAATISRRSAVPSPPMSRP